MEQLLASKRLPPASSRVAYFPYKNIRAAASAMAEQQPQAVILAAPTIASAQFVRECQQLMPGTQFLRCRQSTIKPCWNFSAETGTRHCRLAHAFALQPGHAGCARLRQTPETVSRRSGVVCLAGRLHLRQGAGGRVEAGQQGRGYQAAFANMKPLELGGYQVNFSAGNSSNFVDVLVFSQQGA